MTTSLITKDKIKTCTGIGAFFMASWAMMLMAGFGFGAHWMSNSSVGRPASIPDIVMNGGLYKVEPYMVYELSTYRSAGKSDKSIVWGRSDYPVGKYFTITNDNPVIVDLYEKD